MWNIFCVYLCFSRSSDHVLHCYVFGEVPSSQLTSSFPIDSGINLKKETNNSKKRERKLTLMGHDDQFEDHETSQ